MNEGGDWLEEGDSVIHLYVDGSCADNQQTGPEQKAAWGLVVVIGDSGLGRGNGDIIHEKRGLVVCDEESEEWIGAETASNNTAELSGLIHALRWLLIEGGGKVAVIRSDSKYALNIASGTWRAKANKLLAARSQKLWQEVATLNEVKGEHIRAHRGHRWNERADHLAFRTQAGESVIPLGFWKPGQR